MRGFMTKPPDIMPQDKKYWHYSKPTICEPCAAKLLEAIFGKQEPETCAAEGCTRPELGSGFCGHHTPPL